MRYDLTKAKQEVLDDLRPSWYSFYLIDADRTTLNAGRRKANAFLKDAERERADKEIVKAVYDYAYGKCRPAEGKKKIKKKHDFSDFSILDLADVRIEEESRDFPLQTEKPSQADDLLNYEADRILFRYSSGEKYWYPDNAADAIEAVAIINKAILIPDAKREKEEEEEEEEEEDFLYAY